MNNQLSTVTATIFAIKSIVPKNFAKTFDGLTMEQIAVGMNICIFDLSQEQIEQGLIAVRKNGFCPDPALFRRWCLGLKDFDNTDVIADSYINKHGALSQIIKWQNDPKTPITVAMKQAYDETYHLWISIQSSSDTTKAELAFKDCYQMIVREFVKNKKLCEPYVMPTAISQSSNEQKHTPVDGKEAQMNIDKIKRTLGKKVA
ncbi:hypothetical protein LU293_04355 [Moraxella nasovis]|uniref:hypothetical protein n=1 Tax=Moraxella nasovis TaxID=2904121 RepID=UPI001F60B86B|nr:hypothetical protein [Moraxella nasovis]UNU74135.1 hypothetical protein LU293_04355 [Moraxella nasovis]